MANVLDTQKQQQILALGRLGWTLRRIEQALAAADSLATLSGRGHIVPELSQPNTREIFVFRYRLLYEVEPDAVHIVAFLHGARDFERWRRETER